MTPLERFVRLRKLLGFSQREMAKEFGVNHATVSLWEKGERTISGSILKLIDLYEDQLGLYQIPKPTIDLKKLNTSWWKRPAGYAFIPLKIIPQMTLDFCETLFGKKRSWNVFQQKLQITLAKQLVNQMGEMKGLSMKAGQLLSYLEFSLPDSVRAVFETLRVESKPISSLGIANQFLAGFQKTPTQLFKSWYPKSIAQASIAQVHRAVLKTGEVVAVKVQYPEIAQALKADLYVADLVDRFITTALMPYKHPLVCDRMRHEVTSEYDFLTEAASQEKFRQWFVADPAIKIAKVYPAYSTSKILTMEYLAGESFADFEKSASQNKRNWAARKIAQFIFESVFCHSCNSDMHPGNYLFTQKQVAFLDFGYVYHYDRFFIRNCLQLMGGLQANKSDQVDEAFVKINPEIDVERFNLTLNREVLKKFYAPLLDLQVIEWNSERLKNLWKSIVVPYHTILGQPLSCDWLMLYYCHWGLYSLLARLRAQVNLGKIFLQVQSK